MPDMQKGPMSVTAIIERLRGLEAKATKGPWHTQPCSNGGLILRRGDAFWHLQAHVQIAPEHDAALIAETRNLLPALLDCAEACRLLLDSYQTDDRGATSYGLGKLAEARAKATEALAALERAGK